MWVYLDKSKDTMEGTRGGSKDTNSNVYANTDTHTHAHTHTQSCKCRYKPRMHTYRNMQTDKQTNNQIMKLASESKNKQTDRQTDK